VRRLVFLGPPGAGKGTQAAILAQRWGIVHLSTGDLLRDAAARKTSLGLEADGYMRQGKLVPDDLVLRILQERLARPDTRSGFLLDGYPRTRPQAESLAQIAPVDRVVSFEIPESLLVQRLIQRRSCPVCGAVYNLETQPPVRDELCDRDGTPLRQRADDAPEAVRTRLRVYGEQTAPLLEYYAARGLLAPVDATGSRDEVTRRIEAVTRAD
jgi:adenylate kinase